MVLVGHSSEVSLLSCLTADARNQGYIQLLCFPMSGRFTE